MMDKTGVGSKGDGIRKGGLLLLAASSGHQPLPFLVEMEAFRPTPSAASTGHRA